MKITLVIATILASSIVFAGNKKAHRHHEAHVHGAATLSLAFDHLKGKLEFKAASEGLLGFEHTPVLEKDKKKLNELVAKFETSIGSMVKFDESLGCSFIKEQISMISEKQDSDEKKIKHKSHKGEHSNFIANYSVECKREIKGSTITFDFAQFKGLKELDVTLLVGDLQKTVELKDKPITVELK